MALNELLATGTSPAVTVRRDATASAAARAMRDHGIGFVIVVDDTDHVVGVVTDRDLVVRLVADDRSPDATTVGSIMSHRIATIRADRSAAAAAEQMALHRCRRLPICAPDDRVVGVITLGDIQRSQAVMAQQLERLLGGGSAVLVAPVRQGTGT